MKRALLIGSLCFCLSVVAYASTGKYTTTLTADGNCDVAGQAAGKTVQSLSMDVRGTWGGGTITFKATADGTNYANILDATGSGVTCSGTACTCTSNCIVQVKGATSSPYQNYRATLSGSAAPNLVCTAYADLRP